MFFILLKKIKNKTNLSHPDGGIVINCTVLMSRAIQVAMPDSPIHGRAASSLIFPTDVPNEDNQLALMRELAHARLLALTFLLVSLNESISANCARLHLHACPLMTWRNLLSEAPASGMRGGLISMRLSPEPSAQVCFLLIKCADR